MNTSERLGLRPVTTPEDPVRVRCHLDAPSRWLWLVKWCALAVPHYPILILLYLVYPLTTVVAGIAILFRSPISGLSNTIDPEAGASNAPSTCSNVLLPTPGRSDDRRELPAFQHQVGLVERTYRLTTDAVFANHIAELDGQQLVPWADRGCRFVRT